MKLQPKVFEMVLFKCAKLSLFRAFMLLLFKSRLVPGSDFRGDFFFGFDIESWDDKERFIISSISIKIWIQKKFN